MVSKEKSFAEVELEKWKRARDRARLLGFEEYVSHLERIVEELEEIDKLDEKYIRGGL